MRRRQYLAVVAASMAGLSGCLGESEYEITDVSVSTGSTPLSLELTVVDGEILINDPGALEITLQNQTSPLEIRSTGIWPTGVLRLSKPSVQWKVLLRSEQYSQSDRIEMDETGISVSQDPLIRNVDPNESVTRQYTLHVGDLSESGQYVMSGYFDETILSYREPGKERWSTFLPDIGVTISEKSSFL